MPIGINSDAIWEADRIAQVLYQYAMPPGSATPQRTDWPDEVILRTATHAVVGRRAPWLIGQEPWVRLAVRAVEDEAYITNTSVTHGFLFLNDEILYLNDVATMRGLGGRVGVDLDPLAYVELLGELYSGSPDHGPVARPTAATPEQRAGELIRDGADLHARFAFVDPALVEPPRVSRSGAQTSVEFFSFHYYVTGQRAIDIIRWRVSCVAGQDASWQRDYVVRRLEGL